jgi:hypothetical protein
VYAVEGMWLALVGFSSLEASVLVSIGMWRWYKCIQGLAFGGMAHMGHGGMNCIGVYVS